MVKGVWQILLDFLLNVSTISEDSMSTAKGLPLALRSGWTRRIQILMVGGRCSGGPGWYSEQQMALGKTTRND